MTKLLRTVRKTLNAAVAPFGIKVMRLRDTTLRTISESCDPIAPTYTGAFAPYVVNVALANCRALQPVFYAFGQGSRNPYSETLRRFANGTCTRFCGSPLEAHYQRWQPRNAAEAIGLGPHAHSSLLEASPINFVFPWDSFPPSAVRRIQKIEQENASLGHTLAASAGHQCIGPVSPDKGQLEFERFAQVFRSIRDRGYLRTSTKDGDIRGRILRSKGRSVVIVTTGVHRLVAVSVLGYERVPVRICWPPIYREDIGVWPNVQSGLFSEAQGAHVFDRIFQGNWPSRIGYEPEDEMCGRSIEET